MHSTLKWLPYFLNWTKIKKKKQKMQNHKSNVQERISPSQTPVISFSKHSVLSNPYMAGRWEPSHPSFQMFEWEANWWFDSCEHYKLWPSLGHLVSLVELICKEIGLLQWATLLMLLVLLKWGSPYSLWATTISVGVQNGKFPSLSVLVFLSSTPWCIIGICPVLHMW